MFIFPTTFFYLCPVLELQRHNEWSTICATHGRRRSRHLCPVRALALALPAPWAWTVTLRVQGFWCGSQRLTETSDLNRGCGGIVILWHKSLLAIPLDVQSTKALFILRHDYHWSLLAFYWPPDWRIWQLFSTARRYIPSLPITNLDLWCSVVLVN